jgi:hypothetical protein
VSGVSFGRVLRTVRHLRLSQAVAQLRHVLVPHRQSAAALDSEPPPLTARAAAVPFLPPPRHVRAWRHRDTTTIRLLNREISFRGEVDWGFEGEGPLFGYQLHHFDFARDAGLCPDDRYALMLDWIENHAAGVGWDPHPLSHRILAWGKLLLTPGALPTLEVPEAARALRSSLAVQVDALSRNLEVRLQANHLFTNLIAVVFGGMLLDGSAAQRWLARSEALRAELRDQVHPDGAHEERSPMYHALLLEQVLDLLNLLSVLPERAPDGLAEDLADTASRMCGALEVWTHPDGEIALFSDAAFGIAPRPAELADYAAALAVPVQLPEQRDRLPYGGFVRLVDSRFHLVASLAGPSPDHQPGHAHCDALAFELCVDGQRVVTDTGVFEYLPGANRDLARATSSHATIEIGGGDQAELWAAHRVAGRPDVRVLDYSPGRACEASCEGFASRGVVHRRRFSLEDTALEDTVLVVTDAIEGGELPVRLILPLAPGLRARLEGADGEPRRLRVLLASGRPLLVDLPGAAVLAWRLERCDYFPEFGRRERRWRLVGEGVGFTAGSWRFTLAD